MGDRLQTTSGSPNPRRTLFRQFAQDSMIYGATGILVRGVPILLLPFYTRVFSTAAYGTLELLTILVTLANIVFALEITQAVGRLYADAPTSQDRTDYASTAFWFTVATFSVFVPLAYVAAGPLSRGLVGSEIDPGAMRAAILSSWPFALFYVTSNQLRWELRPLRYAAAAAVYSATSVGLTVLFVEHYRLGVAGVFYGQLVGTAVGGLVAMSLARSSYGLVVDRRKCREMLAYSAPLVASTLGIFVAYYVDRFSIRQLRSLHDVGLYSAGYRVASMVGLVMVTAQGALTPLVFAHHALSETPGQLARIFRYFLFAALSVFALLSIFSRDLVDIVATTKYDAAAALVSLIVPAILLWNLSIFAPGILIAKRTKYIAGVNVLAGGANAGLCFTLIPFMGIRGAALATLLTALGAFAAFMIRSQQLYPVPHHWRRLAVAVGGVSVAIVALELAFESGHLIGSSLETAAWKVAAVVLCMGFAGAMLIDRRELLAFARSRLPMAA